MAGLQAAKFPEDIKREHGGARIIITDVKKHHAGKYNCLAENVAGVDRATIDIHVAGKPSDSCDPSVLNFLRV